MKKGAKGRLSKVTIQPTDSFKTQNFNNFGLNGGIMVYMNSPFITKTSYESLLISINFQSFDIRLSLFFFLIRINYNINAPNCVKYIEVCWNTCFFEMASFWKNALHSAAVLGSWSYNKKENNTNDATTFSDCLRRLISSGAKGAVQGPRHYLSTDP